LVKVQGQLATALDQVAELQRKLDLAEERAAAEKIYQTIKEATVSAGSALVSNNATRTFLAEAP
jgi:hypothetical protein